MDRMIDRTLYYLFYGVGALIGLIFRWTFIGLYRLVVYGIFRYQRAHPAAFYAPDELRFEHTLITCGSGWGKTQLLQQMILQDLPGVEGRQSSVVVMDSQGDMIKKILHLAELSPRYQKASVEEHRDTSLWPIVHVFLVFVLLVVLALISGMTLEIAQTRHWPNYELVAFVPIIPLGLLFGAWLRKKRRRVCLIQLCVGAVAFLAFALSISPKVDMRSIFECLGTFAPLLLGFILTSPRAADRPAAKPAKASVAPLRPNLSDRFILIDPNDVENPPCLNLFDFGLERLKHYEPVEQERLINGAIAMYEFMFGALLGAELTNRQGVIFRYLARLMMVVPNATIYTLMDFLENPETVRQYIPKLDLTTQRFLQTQFLSSGFDTTREQILTRLWGVLSNSALARMFSHTHNKLNLFEAMNNGSLILINTAKDLLKQEGCEIFGRFMVALISQATQERAALAEHRRIPTFVYIDEAHDYFDETLEQLLNTARKYRVGIHLAHQNLGQFHRKLEQTVLASTSQKWAGGNSSDDAYQLAKEMNCEPDFIRQLQKEPSRAHFAFYARNKTPTAIDMIVPFGQMENRSKMTSEEYKELIAKNRKRVAAPYDKNLLTQSSAVAQSGVVFDLEEQRAI